MKIAIYRNDFDPINFNNVSVVCEILDNLSIDELWIVINTKKCRIKFNHRLSLCKKELKGLDKIKILFANHESDYDYLNSFKETFVNDVFYWFIDSSDFNKLNINSKFLFENKFIINQDVLINENLLKNALSYSLINVPYDYRLIDVIESIKHNKINFPFISLNIYNYLKNILQ